MVTYAPLWTEVQRIIHTVLEAWWAKISSCVICWCRRWGADGGSAQTGCTTGASLWGTSDKKALWFGQVLHLVHHTCNITKKYKQQNCPRFLKVKPLTRHFPNILKNSRLYMRCAKFSWYLLFWNTHWTHQATSAWGSQPFAENQLQSSGPD